jgi:hypothetical protein
MASAWHGAVALWIASLLRAWVVPRGGIRELHPTGRHVILVAASEGAHAVPGCEGLVVDLDALWAEVHRLPESEEGLG